MFLILIVCYFFFCVEIVCGKVEFVFDFFVFDDYDFYFYLYYYCDVQDGIII